MTGVAPVQADDSEGSLRDTLPSMRVTLKQPRAESMGTVVAVEIIADGPAYPLVAVDCTGTSIADTWHPTIRSRGGSRLHRQTDQFRHLLPATSSGWTLSYP